MALACLGLTAWGALNAQTEKDAEEAFRHEVINQRLVPHGFSAEPEVDYRWTPAGVQTDDPAVHTFGAFQTDSVNVKHDRIELQGIRYTLVKDEQGQPAFSGGASALLFVDLQGADPATVLSVLKNQLFYPSIDAAQADIPAAYRKMLPYDPAKFNRLKADSGSPHEKPSIEGCSADATLTLPKLTHQVNPKFSKESRRAKIGGDVVVAITVDDAGKPTDLWLAAAAGPGLDAEALEAVEKYRFKPATCNGAPVPVPLFIEVNFKILR